MESSGSAQKEAPSFWGRSWVIGSVVLGVLTWVLLNGPSALSNARILPGEWQKTLDAFLVWYYDDEKWTGAWSSREEGDIHDYKQADLPLKLTIESKQGKVFGEMFNISVCELNPMFPPVLVEGAIRGGNLVASAFVYVGGERKLLYEFSGKQSDHEPVLTITPLQDRYGLLPSSARLVQGGWGVGTVQIDSGVEVTAEHPDLQCPESPIEYIQRFRKEGHLEGAETTTDASGTR